VIVLGDGLIGQMMEPVEFKAGRKPCKPLAPKQWATTGWKGDRPRAIINSLFLDPEVLERHNRRLAAKYEAMRRDDVRYAEVATDRPYDVLVVAYGTVARVVSTALEDLEAGGIHAAMFRPITLFPFPEVQLRAAVARASAVLVFELSTGQMVEDVRLTVEGRVPVHFHGRQGGMLITPEEAAEKVREVAAGVATREAAHV
jgi:2-oxoglutarate ferredoxin oxidoreductase subunit alpha